MFGWKLRLPIDIKFGLTSSQAEKHSHKNFGKLNAWLRWCYEQVDLHQCTESTHHKWWYDQKMRAFRLEPGDLCLVKQKVFGDKNKISDHWENTKYMVIEWQLNLPVYTIKPWKGEGWTWVFNRNLLMHIVPSPNRTKWSLIQVIQNMIHHQGT